MVAALLLVGRGERRARGTIGSRRKRPDAQARAAAYFRDEVAVHGSYGWRYSADLAYRRGEDLMTPSQGWVQPPGTPAVGLAMLQAYAATEDRAFLEGAVEAARALAATQLESGGWHAMIEFDPEQQKAWCYRRLPDGSKGPRGAGAEQAVRCHHASTTTSRRARSSC